MESRIEDLRAQRGIPLAALAVLTQHGNETLSELNRGQRNPTLDTLFASTTPCRCRWATCSVTESLNAAGRIASSGPRSAALSRRWGTATRLCHLGTGSTLMRSLP
ncbi:helix-turn-helix transcriptional regulator [Microbacterium resistens]|nr:helix-turn-helix transcriptional regulator [Microbacterium resistens]